MGYPGRMSAVDYSALYRVFRETGVVDRESFTLPSTSPDYCGDAGRISAGDFAHELLRVLGRCAQQEGVPCSTCKARSCR